jgi:hypothetical protein
MPVVEQHIDRRDEIQTPFQTDWYYLFCQIVSGSLNSFLALTTFLGPKSAPYDGGCGGVFMLRVVIDYSIIKLAGITCFKSCNKDQRRSVAVP